MAKFYVESGDIREIVDAPNQFDACFVALQRHIRENVGVESHMTPEFMVSQQGFISDREGFVFTYPVDDIVKAQDIMDRLYE